MALSCEAGPGLPGVCTDWNNVPDGVRASVHQTTGGGGDLDRGGAAETESEGSGLTRGLIFASLLGALLFAAHRTLGRRGRGLR